MVGLTVAADAVKASHCLERVRMEGASLKTCLRDTDKMATKVDRDISGAWFNMEEACDGTAITPTIFGDVCGGGHENFGLTYETYLFDRELFQLLLTGLRVQRCDANGDNALTITGNHGRNWKCRVQTKGLDVSKTLDYSCFRRSERYSRKWACPG